MPTMRLSNWLAMRCKEEAFRRFLRVPDEQTAVTTVRRLCGVESRSELDRDPVAAHRFHKAIRLPYSQYLQDHPQT